MVKVVASDSEFEKEIEFNGLVVVDFFAQWCPPCKMIAPKIDAMAKENENVKFLKVDVDDKGTRKTTTAYKIRAMPTFMFIKNKKVIKTITGADELGIRKAVKDLQ